ncbi:MAG: hypothetical protein ACXWCY_31685 [Burkholderiales bacterium]
MLKLNDQQLHLVMHYAASIPTVLRSAFMNRVSATLSGREIDDGDVAAAVRAAAKAMLPRQRGMPAMFMSSRRDRRFGA